MRTHDPIRPIKQKDVSLNYISLFSSAGVGCYGFSMEGFDCIASVELIERRLNVQRHNGKCRYESGYIADDIKKQETKQRIFSEIELWKKNHGTKEVDVIIATPPCQGMSVANHKKNNESERNSLVIESVNLVSKIKPKVFLFENVRAFLSTECTDLDGQNKTIREAIELNLGGRYNIHFQVINFKDYGNPSSRTRTLVIGVRKDIQEITPLDLFPQQEKSVVIKQVIGDLQPLVSMGEISKQDIYHSFRPYDKRMIPWVENIKEGQSAFDNEDPARRPHRVVGGIVIQNKNKNSDKYSRCFWNKTGPCIHTRSDIFASQSTIHPADNRVFSIRELMRLMSIPDSFKWSNIPFEDLNNLSDADKAKYLKKEEPNIRQSIGEAVPTVIFNKIAKNIKKVFNKNFLDSSTIKSIVNKYNLTDNNNLRTYLKDNINKLAYSELAKITEVSNSERVQTAAYYTRQDICFTLIKSLPEANNFERISILEPSVGAGNFLPLIIEKYKTVDSVEIDVIDIDNQAIETLKLLTQKITIPKNIKINFINEDFLLYGKENLFGSCKHYDIVIGNPPFGNITKNKSLLSAYKSDKYNKETSNLFSFFIEKSISSSDFVSLIIPKSFLSAPEFNKTRELVSRHLIQKIVDYGEKAFKGVKIETIGIIINTKKKSNKTQIESYVTNESRVLDQSYITSSEYPYWLIYRNEFFDSVAKKLEFNLFKAFRDRQITKKITKQDGKIRVIKSRNIANNKILDIPNYDTFIDDIDSLSVSKFFNNTECILVPNLTYNPRASFMPENSIADGSVAILKPTDSSMEITAEDLSYFSTEEYRKFYMIARNLGTRSLNIDRNSIFFFGIPKQNHLARITPTSSSKFVDVERFSPYPVLMT